MRAYPTGILRALFRPWGVSVRIARPGRRCRRVDPVLGEIVVGPGIEDGAGNVVSIYVKWIIFPGVICVAMKVTYDKGIKIWGL